MSSINMFIFQDAKLLTSVSATERNRLWDRFNGQIDQDAIKLEFFRKVHKKNPPFRIKVRLPSRLRVNIPPMVKYHYKKPVELLPSLRQVLRLNSVTSRQYCSKLNGCGLSKDADLDDESQPFNLKTCEMEDERFNNENVQNTGNNVDKDVEFGVHQINRIFELNGESQTFLDGEFQENENKHNFKTKNKSCIKCEANGISDDDSNHSNCKKSTSQRLILIDNHNGSSDYSKDACGSQVLDKYDSIVNGDNEQNYIPNGIHNETFSNCDMKNEYYLSHVSDVVRECKYFGRMLNTYFICMWVWNV